jgi:hypothetical protein
MSNNVYLVPTVFIDYKNDSETYGFKFYNDNESFYSDKMEYSSLIKPEKEFLKDALPFFNDNMHLFLDRIVEYQLLLIIGGIVLSSEDVRQTIDWYKSL